MATAGEILSVIQEVEAVSNAILAEVSALDPALELPTAIITAIEGLANSAIGAWSSASGTPITVASVQALLPDPTPLTPPTA